MNTYRILPIVTLLAAWAYGISSLAFAADSEQHLAGERGTPMLNHGRKWATADLLRKEMVEVRETVTSHLDEIDKGKLTLDDYKALGAAIEHQVAGIVAQCKLPASADATFHVVIADLLAGAATLPAGQNKGRATPRHAYGHHRVEPLRRVLRSTGLD